MKRVDLRVFLTAALLVLFYLFRSMGLGMEYAAAGNAEARDISINERLVQEAGQEIVYRFTPASNNIYSFQSFSNAAVEGTLYAEDQASIIASDKGFQFEARLSAEDTYYLKVVTPPDAGDCAVEIMRAAFGRCYDRPIELSLEDEDYKKVIARPYDTHWYRFTADVSGLYTVRTGSTMDMTGYILEAGGRAIAHSNNVYASYGQDFYIQAELKAGEVYYVRICAGGDQIGEYRLLISRPVPDAPQVNAISLEEHELKLTDGDQIRLNYELSPPEARPEIMYISSQPGIVSVLSDGTLVAHGPGEAEIIVIAGASVYDVCRVEVRPVPVEGIVFLQEDITLTRGQELNLEYAVLPPGASNTKIVFESSDEGVATVNEKGILTAVAPGEAVITATTEDGGYTAQAILTVKEAPPRYRALLLGEQQYVDDKVRIGSVNTTQGMADMLGSLTFHGETYNVTMRMDSTRAEVIRRIRYTFRDAKETDVSLFYINCHGDYENGVAYLKFHDSSRLTAGQLERELRRIPGTVIVIIDCCRSGGFLSGEAERFGDSMVQVFGRGAASAFAMSKYIVLTSASSTQNSQRVSYDREKLANEATMTTAFAQSLCESAGWNLLKDKRQSMKADLDKNRVVTLHEAYLYARRRTRELLKEKGEAQDVQVYPMGSSFPLFERT